MKIILSPQRRDDSLAVSKVGDVLTINGDAFDFSAIPDGGEIPAGVVPCRWITGPLRRVAGDLELTLILPHGSAPSNAVAFPQPIVDPPDGMIAMPHDEEA